VGTTRSLREGIKKRTPLLPPPGEKIQSAGRIRNLGDRRRGSDSRKNKRKKKKKEHAQAKDYLFYHGREEERKGRILDKRKLPSYLFNREEKKQAASRQEKVSSWLTRGEGKGLYRGQRTRSSPNYLGQREGKSLLKRGGGVLKREGSYSMNRS